MKRILTFILVCVAASASARDFHIDFSRVGYMWGEKPIPHYENKIVLTAPADYADATAMIQEALDKVEAPGAVLLKEGLYIVGEKLIIRRNGVVLRGEGNGTVVKSVGPDRRSLVTIDCPSEKKVRKLANIVDDMTPVGQLWVRVDKPSKFKVGDRIEICARPNERWVKDLKMDQIVQRKGGTGLKQWTPEEYVIRWERIVVDVEGDKVHIDNPIVMELDKKYMSASVYHVSRELVSQSGIENIMLESFYDPTVTAKIPHGKFKGMVHCSDEDHSWNAIDVNSAEHCWVKGVTSRYFAFALISLNKGAKNITVKDCVCTEPVSYISGGRRYAFNLGGGQLCLVENCRAEHDRHGFVTGARVPGPNVFVDCDMVHAYSDIGPHHRWASGVLYDNCTTDGLLSVQDRADYGTGHGWAGVSFVFWNCVADTIICQSPWVNGKNWCIGCVGEKLPGRPYSDKYVRPDGEWESHGKKVEPASLYRTQLASRKIKITSILK